MYRYRDMTLIENHFSACTMDLMSLRPSLKENLKTPKLTDGHLSLHILLKWNLNQVNQKISSSYSDMWKIKRMRSGSQKMLSIRKRQKKPLQSLIPALKLKPHLQIFVNTGIIY